MLAPLIEADEGSHMYISDNVDELDEDEESPPTDKEECHVISNTAVSGYLEKTAYKYRETKLSAVSQVEQQTKTAPLFKFNGATVADKSNLETVCTISKSEKKKNKFHLVAHAKKKSKKREKNAARRERKATKTLAIVLGTIFNIHILVKIIC